MLNVVEKLNIMRIKKFIGFGDEEGFDDFLRVVLRLWELNYFEVIFLFIYYINKWSCVCFILV